MIEWALDENNDIVLKNGSCSVIQDAAQVAQHVRTRLLFYLGEWFLDARAGTPWFQEVFVKPVNLPLVESIIKSRITNTPGVQNIVEFSMEFPDPSSRRLEVQFSAVTTFGSTITETITV